MKQLTPACLYRRAGFLRMMGVHYLQLKPGRHGSRYNTADFRKLHVFAVSDRPLQGGKDCHTHTFPVFRSPEIGFDAKNGLPQSQNMCFSLSGLKPAILSAALWADVPQDPPTGRVKSSFPGTEFLLYWDV